MRLPTLITFLLLFTGCSAPATDTAVPPAPNTSSASSALAEGNAGSACSAASDCQTPMNYLVRSNCPFTSLCIEGVCAVVCPIPSAQSGWTKPLSCEKDANCDCSSYAAQDKRSCKCIEGACVSVME